MTPETGIYAYAKHGLSLSADRPALWFYGKSITYRELFEKIDNTADHLYALGVREGTVVTIHLPNCPQAVIAIYAVAKLGGICNMVHAQTPAAALRENMVFTESDVLITYLPDCTSGAKTALYVDISHHMGFFYRIGYRVKSKTRRPNSITAFESFERPCSQKAAVPEQDALAEKCAVYLHSSGSTGRPKTILHSHSALNHSLDNVADYFENGDIEDQVSLGVLPFFHGYALAMDVHRNIFFGSKLIMMSRWNAKSAVKLIKKHKVSLIIGVPTIFYALINEPTFRGKGISELSKGIVAGDNVDPTLIENFDSRIDGKRHLYAGYGLTEAIAGSCVNNYLHYKCGSDGYPARNTAMAVMDEGGRLSPTGKGELVISSPTLMMGYLKDPEATKNTMFTADGKLWIHTGDEVEIDEEGFLFFKARVKNIIIHNGYNIYPEQVGDVIRRLPVVQDVCVVGVFDEKLHTQNVRAAVILQNGADPNAAREQVRQACLENLPRYAIPKEIVFVDSFPRNAMGKINRKELTELENGGRAPT